MTLHKEKYEQVILFLCSKLGGEVRGKKKLAKLLYFTDFDFFEKTEKSITGDTYKAFPMGPLPASLEKITVEMVNNKVMSIETIAERDGYIPTEIYRSLSNPDMSVFDEQEKEMLERIVLKYGHLTGKQLEDLSHAEAPYIGTELRHDIPYELAFYRGTDFEDI
jgi:uncharacterized phage-associated protein